MAKDFDREAETMANKPDKKRFRGAAKRLRDGKNTHTGHKPSLDWRLDSRTICGPNGKNPAIATLASLVETLRVSRTAAALLDADNAPEIIYDMQIPASQYYPRKGKPVITLNPHRPRGDLLNLLTRELRRHWQHMHGALVNPLNFEPDEAILINRAQAADALMISIKAAWEMKLSGEQEAWNWLAGSPAADMGRTFEVKARSDFRTLNNGEAARAAYDKFFEDSRTKVHDKRIIHQMLLDESGYMRMSQKTPASAAEIFKRLGELPAGRNYLSMKAGRAPTDAVYATIEDRSNANFLWFIKFERSFQEKEKQMIEDSVKLSAEIIDFAKWSLARLRDDEPVNAGL
jgi:hypothetical protein